MIRWTFGDTGLPSQIGIVPHWCMAGISSLRGHGRFHVAKALSFERFLKTMDTIGNCSKTSLLTWCISTFMHKITNLWKFELVWSSELRDNYERKKHPSKFSTWGLKIKFVENYFCFSKCFVLSFNLSTLLVTK